MSAAPASILELLREQPAPLTQAAIVQRVGLHPNTVREHLGNLLTRGLVVRFKAEPQGRGRPAWLYEASGDQADVPEYARLASALAVAIARTSTEPTAEADSAGTAWGQDLARSRHCDPAAPAREKVLQLLEGLGFAPRQAATEPDHIDLTRCPLLQAAHRYPDVVCAVHLGLVRGALTEFGGDPSGSSLVPFARPGACLLIMPAAHSS